MHGQLHRQQLQALRSSLTSEVLMLHEPVLGQWLGVMEEALSGDWRRSEQLREALGIREQSQRTTLHAGGIAVVPVTGMIRHKNDIWVRFGLGTSNLQVAADVQAAAVNPKVRAIVLDVDSPGGLALGNEEASAQIFAARGAKPIVASINGYGASAAYYLAAAADRVVASASSITPSVGTMLVHVEWSKALDEFGITPTVLKYGANKGTGNVYEKLSPQSKALLQEYINEHGEQFVAAVARYRNLSVAHVNEQFGQGFVMSPERAKAAGVIDAIANFDDVLAELAGGETSGTTATAAIPSTIRLAAESPLDLQRVLDQALPTGMLSPTEHQAASEPPLSSTAASAALTPSRSEEHPLVNKKIKAALYALGYVDSQEASDEVCSVALNAFYLAHGRKKPEADAQILRDLAAAAAAETSDGGQQSAAQQSAAASAQPPTAVNVKEVEEQMLARHKEIKANGQLKKVPQAVIDTALEANLSVDQAREKFDEYLAQQEQPLDDAGDVRGGTASHDKLLATATAVLLDRAGMWPASEKHPEGFAQHQSDSVMSFVRADLSARGVQLGRHTSNEQAALTYLQLDQGLTVVQSGGNYLRPGDYPNLLSNLMGKMLDQAIEVADPTYPMWTARMSDVPDFKPRTIIGVGRFDELNLVDDDDEAESINASEEIVGWIKADRYNGKAGLTPVMLANDDLDAFMTMLQSMAVAHENTLNRLCVELIATNPTLLDGTALFHADHKNLVDSGGAPSEAEAKKMWQQWFKQTDFGSTGKTIRTPPKTILYPAILDYVVKQTFAPFAGMVESKQATTDANLNITRGQFEFIREPELDSHSAVQWYWLADPRRRRAFVHMFMQGYGRGGRRTSWFDADRETRYYKLEGRFGAANAGYRGVLRNDGEA